jgi:hypothetical protein
MEGAFKVAFKLMSKLAGYFPIRRANESNEKERSLVEFNVKGRLCDCGS